MHILGVLIRGSSLYTETEMLVYICTYISTLLFLCIATWFIYNL